MPFRLALARVPRIGAKRMALLEAHFESVADAWTAADGDLREAGMDAATLRSLHQARGRTDPDEEMAALEASGARAISVQDEAYPARLREIYDPPPAAVRAGGDCAGRRLVGGGGGDAGGCRRTGDR